MQTYKFKFYVLAVFIQCLVLNLGAVRASENAAPTLIPLVKENWTLLKYSKIEPNQIEFKGDKMSISVVNSASPIFYKLPQPIMASSFLVRGEYKGQKKLEVGKFDEDSLLRMGLVATGKTKMNRFQYMFAAQWVKRLFDLAPKNVGIDKIYFYNITNRNELVGQSRAHPKTEFIHESIVNFLPDNPTDSQLQFQFSHRLERPTEVAAIWLSLDGDDSKSTFHVDLSEITLNPSTKGAEPAKNYKSK